MTKIDWVRKLTSRKFWVAVATFVTAILTATGMSDNKIGQIVAIIMAGASAVAYIIGEGLVDAAREGEKEAEE